MRPIDAAQARPARRPEKVQLSTAELIDLALAIGTFFLAGAAWWSIRAAKVQADLARKAFELQLSLPLRVEAVDLKRRDGRGVKLHVTFHNETTMPVVLDWLEMNIVTRIEGGPDSKPYVVQPEPSALTEQTVRPGRTTSLSVEVAPALEEHQSVRTLIWIQYTIYPEYVPS